MEKKGGMPGDEVSGMLRKKDIFYLTVNDKELRLLLAVMLWFRNRTLREGKPIEDINRVITEIVKVM